MPTLPPLLPSNVFLFLLSFIRRSLPLLPELFGFLHGEDVGEVEQEEQDICRLHRDVLNNCALADSQQENEHCEKYRAENDKDRPGSDP